MARRTNAQLDADKLREAGRIAGTYGAPHLVHVMDVIADSIELGRRKKWMGKEG